MQYCTQLCPPLCNSTDCNPAGFPGASDGKSICLQCGRPWFEPWIRKIPWQRKWQPTSVLLPGKFHGWRSLLATVHGVAKSRTQLNDFTFTFHFQASLSMGFFWQECLSGLPFLSPVLNEDFIKYVISSNSSQKAKAVHYFSYP